MTPPQLAAIMRLIERAETAEVFIRDYAVRSPAYINGTLEVANDLSAAVEAVRRRVARPAARKIRVMLNHERSRS